MKLLGCLAIVLNLLTAPAAQAEERTTLGWARLFTNDALGDLEDRWHTGSYSVSRLSGPRWTGTLPETPGEILEYRATFDTIAPANLIAPDADDRRYAGAISLGVASHFDLSGYDVAAGAGLTFVGPSTGIGKFQSYVHQILGLDAPTTVLEDQIPDQVHPFVSVELARRVDLTAGLSLRPFAVAQSGPEDLLRVGVDLTVGRLGRKDLMLRDSITGHLYRGIVGDGAPQFSLVFGADSARVFDSVYLPAGGPAVMLADRDRLRAGYLWQTRDTFVFSGLTYLGPEFASQTEGQVVGSLTVSFAF